MVSKKFRRVIGNWLVWGGLAVITFTNLSAVLTQHFESFSHNWWNIWAVVAILIGGLWGMRG